MRKQLIRRMAVPALGTALIASLVAFSPPGEAASTAEPAGLTAVEPSGPDMPTIGGNLGNQHYSSLAQITKNNLNRLAPTWRTHLSAVEPASDDTGQQTTPIVIDGVIYTDTPSGGVIAVDGKTGEANWKWEPTEFGTSGTRRGVSAGDGLIYTLAAGNRAVALDQETGEQVWVAHVEGPNGEDLGRVDRVGTVYHDGIVYAHAANGPRGAVIALDASDGSYLWHFAGYPERDTIYTDVNGNSIDAAATWGPILPDGTDCAYTGGATPWMHGALDPQLGMYYMTFGNPRSCNSSQDGSQRPGDNVWASTLVAVDMTTGEYRWHYQSIRHDVWDMDNVHPPTLADIEVGGETRQVIFYGSKSGHQFVIDRSNGQDVLPVIQQEMIADSRQGDPDTQPFPEERLLPECLVWEKLDADNIPGDPWRAVPNYNGYQADSEGNLVFNPDSYVKADEPFLSYPDGQDHRQGCMYDPHWDLPILSTTSQNGGGDWTNNSYSHSTNMVYFPYATNPVAHWRQAAGNGQRAIGQYQTGGILAYDASTGEVTWQNHIGTDMAHGQGPLTTASDVLFVGLLDGRFLALDAASGDILWEFQTGSAISGAPITYEIDGEQYVAVLAAGTSIPYGRSVTYGDSLWAFKLGGQYKTESGSQEAPNTAPLSIRRPVQGSPVEGAEVDNTVLLARPDRNDSAASQDSTLQRAMSPTHMRVEVGSTVTFHNPGAETFPDYPNLLEHCATQFFEGEFNPRLQPGETYEHTFDRAGEYFFNDCTDPRPVGKIEVYLEPEDRPGALSFPSDTLRLGSGTGLFTQVRGTVTAFLEVPEGYTYDDEAQLHTPLSESPVTPVRAHMAGKRLLVQFDAADIDNNVPTGSAELTLTAHFIHQGVQKLVTSTTTVNVVK